MKDKRGTTNENDIINKKKQNGRGRTIMIDKHRGVIRRTSETMRQKETDEFMELSPRCLFQFINGLLEFAHMSRIRRMNKSSG